MARAKLITPSRRSARKAVAGTSSGRPKVDKAPSSPKEEFQSRADDVNLKMVDKSQPPIWMRVPHVKSEGSFYKCCVWGCRASGSEPFTGIWLFSLPADEALRSTWCENLPVDPEINRPLSPRVCFQHFYEEDFVVAEVEDLHLCAGAANSRDYGEEYFTAGLKRRVVKRDETYFSSNCRTTVQAPGGQCLSCKYFSEKPACKKG
ncbi:hypothetical protein MTO96_027611 [Rhipicephalus appendiculatus]